jgi:hypothetical protein
MRQKGVDYPIEDTGFPCKNSLANLKATAPMVVVQFELARISEGRIDSSLLCSE